MFPLSNLSVLKKCALFQGLKEKEITKLVTCLGAREKSFQKGEYLYLAGDKCLPAIVLSGKVQLIKESLFGTATIAASLGVADTFGEALTSTVDPTLPANVYAVTDCKVLFLSRTDALLCPCKNVCPEHLTFLKNMITSLAERNKFLMRRLGQVTQHTLREKIASYLSEERTRQKSNSLVIPHNRRELAEYLAVDRSALSAELSKMQKEGLITYEKNRFTLLNAKAFPDEE